MNHAQARLSDGSGFRMTGPQLSTSPEARKVLREQGVDAWRAWVAEHTTTAAPAQESTEPPGKGDRWPGWAQDQATTDHWADVLHQAVSAAIDPEGIAVAWLASDLAKATTEAAEPPPDEQVEPAAVPPPPPTAAAAWAAAQGVAIDAALAAAGPAILVDGYFVGAQAATALIDSVAADWSNWEPGDTDAARKILGADGRGSGLKLLLADSEVRLYGISAARLERFAAILADAAAKGQSVDALAKRLAEFSDNKTWAYVTAQTELARAISAATMDTYIENDVEKHEWSISGPDPKDRVRVCEVCIGNAAVGPIKVGAKFPSGDKMPPGHPRCRCALIPWIDLSEAASPAWAELLAEHLLPVPAELAETEAGGQRLKRWWVHGEGRKRWSSWTSLYRQLKKHLPAPVAKATASRWFHTRYGYWPGDRRNRDAA